MPELAPSSADLPTEWPGRRLGLPEHGSRSIARLGRRIGAIAIDWAIASVASGLITRPSDAAGLDPWVTLGVFAAMQILFIALLSGSIGHLVVGLRVVPLQPAWVGVLKPLIRTVAICLVIPAIIWDADQRGVHDRLAGTVLVRR